MAERFKEMGKELLIHGVPGLSLDERLTIMRRQLTCDLFLSGTNAITQPGCLINGPSKGSRVGD